MFGGVAQPTSVVNGNVATLNDTWEWSPGGGWVQHIPQTSPSPRESAAMAYDPATHAVVLYGGRYVDGGAVHCDDFGKIFCSTDTWSWDGNTWTELHPATAPDMGVSTLAFDYAAERLILYGFNFGKYETWVWDGTAWSGFSGQAGTPQPGRIKPEMTFDPTSGHVAAFGGFSQGGGDLLRMWNWTGSTWTAIQASAPPSTGAATDSGRHGVLLYRDPVYHGTATNYIKDAASQTWRWDGSQWTQLAPNYDPDVFASGMFDDPANNRTLLIGVKSSGQLQIWAWSGSDWSELA